MYRALKNTVLTLVLGASLLAHGGGEHLAGTVKSITQDKLVLETAKHEVLTIVLTAKTKAVKSKAAGDLKDLKAGDRAVVHAAKNKAGQWEAEEVDFGTAPAAK
jgi:hypothetical protein